ncbi:CaiB/BaiF CoA-transferase family protein [Acuticoccus sp. MNP-M23]|uniref:CaiB/BaiF CoA transferase family protein n=1 Tax=Acuticoccus sp. MNP-M23 TaxID=3072793 RepID=UPI0028167950|nr:CaiB/BaiF CoA-transferase family protein [Acuticoccus sp. MNP-M23]WMS42939.1 CaiB/BaiF CoA-transferase family protein [Acuticoccus sp. MNP-M23]
MKLDFKVLSFCHYLQGPAATQYLADMGADVVKVEPLQGAFERHWSGGRSHVNGVSAFLLSANRNKRSLAVDLKHPDGLALVRTLAAASDVVVENFRPGVMDRLGLGYSALKALKPDIIYASATGLGADGPAAMRPGQDLLMQARSGLVAATGGGPQGPTVVGAAVVDQHGASLLAMGILAAFVRKLQTGEGGRVEASLFQAALDLQTEAMTKYFARQVEGDVMARGPNVGSWYHDAPYGAYALADANIVLSMNDAGRLADALDSDRLRALSGIDRYAERERYASAMAEALAPRTFADVSERFDAAGIWHERIQSYDDVRADPQAQHLGAFTEADVHGTPVSLLTHPIKYDGVTPPLRTMPLSAGADSRAILTELGVSDADVDALAARGVIGVPAPHTDQP